MIAFSSILVTLSGASPSTAAVFRCALALPVLGAILSFEDRRLGKRPWDERRDALTAGVLLGIDLIFWHRSIADVGAGIATMVANIQVLIIPFAAWALWKERPGGRVILAVPVALVGLALLSGLLGGVAFGRDPARGIALALLAGAAYVGFLLLIRRGGVDLRRLAGPLFDATLAGAATCLLAGLLIGDLDPDPGLGSFGWLVLLALSSQVLGWMLITSSLPRLPAAVSSLILTVQPVVTIVFAAVILSEDPSPLQLLGAALILSAVVGATLVNDPA